MRLTTQHNQSYQPSKLRVSLIQSSIEWLAADRNRSTAEGYIVQCEGSDLVIFSEMFTTGFCMEPLCCAESGAEGEVTLKWMRQMAATYSTSIVGSVAVEDGGEFYNRLYFVRADGSYVKYDKRHLFSFSGEDRHYRSGEDRVVVELDGVRILLLTCYDIRFPVWCRNRGDYDAIVCVANWPEQRRKVWDILLRARAIENLSYVCGVNIVGSDPTCRYSGGTAVINYLGECVASLKDGECGVLFYELDMEALARFRERFPALEDADDFTLKI
ncbi:MAG: nitrilase-related carbon-nitrogen hydrolase [Rikenellaceae bacterium]